MEIYLIGNRLFMIMEVDETFDPVKKQNGCQSTSSEMGKTLCTELPTSASVGKDGEKWMELEQMFKLE